MVKCLDLEVMVGRKMKRTDKSERAEETIRFDGTMQLAKCSEIRRITT